MSRSEAERDPAATMFRVRSRDVKRHRLARLRDSMGCLHAECSHEDSPTLNVEKHSERGREMYYTSHRDEFSEGILRKRLCGVHWGAHS